VAADPDAYREYVRGSGAEFSPAQGVYVGMNSGWFSDRTACYLAAGKPVVVQDTGLPAGFDGPRVFAIVKVDGLRVFATVTGTDPATIRIGQRVRLAPIRVSDDPKGNPRYLPSFTVDRA